jgi:adenylate cyclase
MAGARILVVDDTPRNRKLLADLLSASGYDVVLAASGPEALQRVAEDRPDLVLLDVVMPEMSGYDVCRAIRARPESAVLPVVMVTALEPSSERIKGLEAGADDFLAKPISQPELLARVRSLLRVKQLYDQVGEQAAQLAEWNRSLEQRVGEQVAALERLEMLKRFLPPQIVEQVVAGGADPLASHRREIVVVALELRGFTAFAETAAPEDAIKVLQEFHQAIGQLVVDYQGTIERVTGDGMMVFFNDPLPQPDAPERALRLALAVRERGRALAAQWAQRGFELHVGLGIAQGYATLGPIGFEARSDYGAIGTVTHIAARLGEAAGPGEILIAQRLHAAIEPLAQCEPAGELTLRGFPRPLATFRALGARRADAVAPRPASAGDTAMRMLRREGEYWTIGYQTEWGRLRGSKGLVYVAHLLRSPGQEFHVLDLIALTRGPVDGAAAADDELAVGGLGDAGELLDARAKQAYRERLADLRAELAEAEQFADNGRTASVRDEIEHLSQQLAAAVGLGGRDRRAAAVTERARVNVTRAISDSLKRIRESAPLMARHLEASIRTGAFCAYQPADSSAVPWQL